MIRSTLAIVLLGLALPATAQTVAPSDIDLTGAGLVANPDLDCAFAVDNVVGWFDRTTQSIFVSGQDLSGPFAAEVYTAAELDALVGTDAVRCRAADFDAQSGTAVFVLSTSTNVDFVFALGTDTVTGNPVPYLVTSAASGAGDGITGVVVVRDRIYVAVQDLYNDPPAGGAAPLGDGVYSFALTGSNQTATPVALDPDLSLVGLDATAVEDGLPFALVAISNRFGAGAYQNKVVQILNPDTAPALSVSADPFDGRTLTVPTDPAQFNLTSIAVALAPGADGVLREAVFVLNNTPAGPNGEEIARFGFGGVADLFTSETRILADLSRTTPGYTPTGGPNALLFDGLPDENGGRLFLLNSDASDGADEVLLATGAYTTPDEAGAPSVAPLQVTAAPNPFRGRLAVGVETGAGGPTTVTVLDALGRTVAVLYDGAAAADQTLRLALDGSALPAGLYLVRAQTSAGISTRTVTLVR